MREWTAKVRTMPLPNFPYEESSFMPIACATVQRVNMSKLCEIVKKAAKEAADAYIDARTLRQRHGVLSRQFPDSCFLTRRQQFDRTKWWNQGPTPLRQCCENDSKNDNLEFDWGYETPERKRSYQDYDKRWDQIDVRMHFFNKYMKKTEWKDAADGMWFVQDYADFMGMLQQLTIEKDEDDSCTHRQDHQLPNYQPNQAGYTLPHRFEVHDRACHRFSVLSWFFDCRDAGACRYRWEDWVLEYFGAYMQQEDYSDFEKFVHVESLPNPQYKYFQNRWFEIVLFLEQNFRNAIAPMHYQLFEFENDDHKATTGLQKDARALYNRKTSMLNNRSVFAGLQVGNGNGASLLSFRRYDPGSNADMTLRERVMSQLHDELPGLDPFLKKYIRQFRIPDAELFLRMIRCPNVLALRELAIQHRYLLGGQNTASSVQQPNHLQQTLKFFPIAVQSEILYMLKFVETDDSVYVHSPAIHETKLMIVPQNLMRKWIREILDVAGRVQSLQTPLQMKCYMFTMQELAGGGVGAFKTFQKLFYTTEAMMNYGSKRGIVFVLLQIRLALLILKHDPVERSNPLVQLFGKIPLLERLGVDEDTEYRTSVWEQQDPVPWRAGTCLECWPRRDQNQFVLTSKNLFVDAIVSSAAKNTITQTSGQFNTGAAVSRVSSMLLSEPIAQHPFSGSQKQVEFMYLTPGTDLAAHDENLDMLEHERCLWLLLLYARPCLQRFTAEDYTSVLQKLPCLPDGKMYTKDVIVAKLRYHISDNTLTCQIDDNEDAPLFFEQIAHKQQASTLQASSDFPEYIQAIISTIPNRKLIYIPKVFAKHLRKQYSTVPLHAQMFKYEKKTWQMVCVGVRHWAWKRLMIKSIFWDAFAKIMTRASVQLSLYGPMPDLADEDRADEDLNQLLQAHKATSSVFGDLQYKVRLLKRNYTKKQVQLVFTVHTKARRVGKINSCVTNFDQDKISTVTRQMEFVKYCVRNSESIQRAHSCRYMLVDKRIVEKFMQTKSWRELPDDNYLLYRSYLFLFRPSTDMLVLFRKQCYIKLPTEYAIIRDLDGYQTGKIIIEEKQYKYATCFDTRTYSCAQPKLQRKADSQDFMKMIQECTDAPKSLFDSRTWPSTNELTEDSKSWIYQKDRKVMLSIPVESTIERDLNCDDVLTLEDQENMYTLPDFFSLETDKEAGVAQKCQSEELVNPIAWTVDISSWPQNAYPTDNIIDWVSLRCTTKTITCHNKTLQVSDDNIEHSLLKPILQKIRSAVKTPSYIDKS
jgi:hypothetical protein